jgi:hypothetical protein
MLIFLSYAREDEEVIKVLATGFEVAHREVWFDPQLGGGDARWDKILRNIRSATVFVFALSDASIQSKPCLAQLDYALALHRNVLPVQVGPVANFHASPLADLQTIYFEPHDALSAFAIIAALDEAFHVPPLPDPLPPPPPLPFAYLLAALGPQIDSTELNQADQLKVVDQLRRAMAKETDESERREILAVLRNLTSKPWSTHQTVREAEMIIGSTTQNEEESSGQRPKPPDGIFLSYRREEAAPYARLLQFQFAERFPTTRVFLDLDSIEAGLDFAEVIRDALDSSAVLIALIGRQWATIVDEEGRRRLDNPDDYVRYEIQTALERGLRVIPVLVDGAKPVQRAQLPSELHSLERLNALELSYGRYQYDADRLLRIIERVLPVAPGGGT